MPYIKLTEYCSKIFFNNSWPIIHITPQTPPSTIDSFLSIHDECILKVDQFVKRRAKKNLILFNPTLESILEFIQSKPFSNFVLEKKLFIKDELYFCIRINNGQKEYILNPHGGIHCDNPVQNATISNSLSNLPSIPLLHQIDQMFDQIYANFLEVNPIILTHDNQYLPADFAIEIDSTSIPFWPKNLKEIFQNHHIPSNFQHNVEEQIHQLDEPSGSSLKFKIVNPEGSILTLIAGGGASVLFTDAIVNRGYANELYNYGEYSGNPTEDEVFQYCDLIFSNWLPNLSKPSPTLFIGGGISNFTDVAKTFNGIIKAIKKHQSLFLDKNVSIWVRRGGVNEKEGLSNLFNQISPLNIPITIKGTDSPITEIVTLALPLLPTPSNSISTNINIPLPNAKNINLWNQKIIFVNNQSTLIQRIIDYDFFIGKKETDILCIYEPFAKQNSSSQFYWGTKRISIPISSNLTFIKQLCQNYTVSLFNYASIRSCESITRKLTDIENIKTVYIIAEGLPERKTIELYNFLQSKNITLLGPSSVGAIKSGKKGQRIGSVGGLIDNIGRCRLSEEGEVVILTKSGGLLNEMINYVTQLGLQVAEAVSIGGDRYSGVRFCDLIKYYGTNPEIKLIILIGETGGLEEVIATQERNELQYVVAWCSGTSEKSFGQAIEFGHAGASALNEFEEANIKNYLMAQNGFLVPNTFEEIGQLILNIKNKLTLTRKQNEKQRNVPIELSDAIKQQIVRIKPSFITNLCDERSELKYRGELVESILEKNYSLGYTIGTLWLNIKLDDWAAKFTEKILVLMADHGPAVSGAHNTIVTARAGKNLVESLSVGLLAIGPRFGGAISEAAKDFYESYMKKETAQDFVERKKNEGKYIMGIGHRIKSKFNPDKRAELIKDLVLHSFPKTNILNHALNIEKETLQKKPNLILNVDGTIGAALVDLLLKYKNEDEVKHLLEGSDIMNGFFVLARSIGFIGHYQEQKEQGNGLYRVNEYDIEYV